MSPGHKFGKRPPVLLLAFAVLLVGLAVGGGYGINLLISNNHPVAMSVSGGSGQAQALPAGAQFMTANELLEAGHLAAGAPPEKRNKLTVYSYYEAGLSKLRAQMPADPAILMKGLRGYGEDLLAIGAFDKAEEVFGEALGLGQTAGDKRFCADCNDHIFVADMNLKLYAKSTQSATQEFELEQAIDPLSDLSVVAASNVAISYFSRGQEYYKTAQDWFEKVHKMTPREPNVDSVVMTKGYAYQYQAIMAEGLGNRQQAGELFEKALPTFKKFPGANSQILKSHYQEMIKHYILTGDKKRADMYQNEAAKLVKG
jgi:tetratricopeptide (TPR) repeat protein